MFVDDAFDILVALLVTHDKEDALFVRMIVTYRQVAIILGCLASYEEMLAGVLALK